MGAYSVVLYSEYPVKVPSILSNVPSTVFLAGSTVELISAMACLNELKLKDAAVFVERNISFTTDTIDSLITAARNRFPDVRFIELEIKRPAITHPRKMPGSFGERWLKARSIQKQLDEVCRKNYQMGLKQFGIGLKEIYFTALHDYVLAFLAENLDKARIFYPHGFDHPRRQQVKEQSYLLRPRSVKTAIQTFSQQKKHFGSGGLLLGVIGYLIPGINTVSLPFTGVDRVITFRAGINFVPNEVTKVEGISEIFQWLIGLQPWHDLLSGRKTDLACKSLLVLLPECDRHPIWEQNGNYGLAHLRLLQTTSLKTGLKQFVLKAHVRSDGSAARWLATFLMKHQPEWRIEILPASLAGLPVEALAMTGEFAAACSLASCSLPPGLGFGIPHYSSLAACRLFDLGWQKPFWLKYSDAAQVLIEEGICSDIDKDSKASINKYG